MSVTCDVPLPKGSNIPLLHPLHVLILGCYCKGTLRSRKDLFNFEK